MVKFIIYEKNLPSRLYRKDEKLFNKKNVCCSRGCRRQKQKYIHIKI